MPKKKDHIGKIEDFLRYLNGEMSPKEQHDFERAMLDDDFAWEAMEGLSQLSNEDISDDLASIHHRLKARTAKGKLWNYWRVAAALLILATFSFMLIYFIDTNTTQDIAQKKEMPSEVKTKADKVEESVLSDSSIGDRDTDEVIAYQQKAVEPEEVRPSSAARTKTSEPQPDIEEEDIVESEVMAEEVELALETFDMEVDDEVQVIAEAEPSPEIAKTNKALSYQASKAPAAMKKESSGSLSRRAAVNVDTRTISGKITSSEDGEALPGVNILVKGTTAGSVSDMDGAYLIEVPSDTATLVVASVGFETAEIKVKDARELDVEISPDVASLSEVVVVGYEKSGDYENTNTPPKPAVGDSAYKLYIKENLRYPESGLADKTKGVVVLKFSVGIDGQILNMEVQKSLGEEFDEEAIRLVVEGPAWKPAVENDSTVVREVKLKIRFRPEK